jgi:glycosyltransferase involved in cell wall biosynthesis
MSLTILSVAYPFARVGPDAVGGAEQVLSMLDRGLVAAGHRSIVIACAGSQVAGTLIPIPEARDVPSEQSRVHGTVRNAIVHALQTQPVDLVHMHGIDFFQVLPDTNTPVLVTLHLPPDWYLPDALHPKTPNIHLHAVSASQHAACPQGPWLLPPIPNGVAVADLSAVRHRTRNYALTLGRICPEKGQHYAIAASRAAGLPLLIAGAVFPYPAHRAYFETSIAPELGPQIRFLGPLGFARKRRLLTAARCLLIPSLAETSSLVAMEAAACGTPVIAFPNGALPEIVRHGETGFLAPDADAMASAIPRCAALDRDTIRRMGAGFDARRTAAAYLARYHALAGVMA